jgi:hypothetical protein
MSADFKQRRVRIFIASPGDVAHEREQLSRVVNSLNSTISAVAPEKGITLELIRYETHTVPGISPLGAEDVILKQLDDLGEYDIFIGIMWKRFGTPTTNAESGTQEEFELAYNALMGGLKKLRHVIFYFCQEKIAIPRTRDEWEQVGKVIEFREKLSGVGLVGEYADRETFGDVVKAHLDLMLSRIFSERGDVARAAERVGEVSLENTAVRDKIMSLARRYVESRREPFSDGRTQKLEVVFTEMKGLAFLAYPLLSELAKSTPRDGGRDERVGERVAAIALLEAIPNETYIDWLADRVCQERPFVGYHAGVALLNAVREFKGTHRDRLRAAIERALGCVSETSDRGRVLRAALNELQA